MKARYASRYTSADECSNYSKLISFYKHINILFHTFMHPDRDNAQGSISCQLIHERNSTLGTGTPLAVLILANRIRICSLVEEPGGGSGNT